MATLTDEQTDFLTSHKIPLGKAFDASGLSSKAYKAKMKDNGTLVAYGVPPCPKGHTLRNKQANCIQCNPQAIASLKRQATAGDVYIAVSASQLLAKIGVTENADNIIEQMNAENHADVNDWQLVLTGTTDSSGQMENHLQQRLADHQIPKKLTVDSKTVKASQIYAIDMDDALEAVNELPFTLANIDTKVMDDYQHRYSEHWLKKQQQTEQIKREKIEAEQAKLAEQQRQKQAELEAQQQAQQRAKQQKLEQKRQRQQDIEAKKQAKLANTTTQPTPRNQSMAVNKSSETGRLHTLSKTAVSANNKFAQLAEHKAVLLFIAGIIVVVGIVILGKLMGK